MIIATTVPTNFFMSFDVVKCWLNIPKLDFTYLYLQSCYIDTNRNDAIRHAKNANEDLLMIDSDIIFTANDIMKMRNHLKTGKEVVTGVYPIFMEGKIIPSVYKKVDGKLEPTEVIGEDYVDACGGGFLGISKDILEKLPPNPFSRIHDGEVIYGEDVSFCMRLADLNIPVICDGTISVGQIRTQTVKLD